MARVERAGDALRALSLRELLAEIAEKASLLIKTEAALAKAEIKADLKAELAMVTWIAVGAVAVLAGVNLLLVALVLALAAWMPAWLAAAGVAVALLVLGAAVAYVGWTRRVTTPLALTRKTLREDVQWAKDRLA